MKNVLLAFCLLISLNTIAQTVTVTGRVFYDNNRNGVFDGNDSVCKVCEVAFYDYNIRPIKREFTDQTGNYNTVIPTGRYVVLSNPKPDRWFLYREAREINKQLKTPSITETINLHFRLKDSIDETFTVCNPQYFEIPTTGGNFNFEVTPSFLGLSSNINGKIILEFDTTIKFVSSDTIPSIVLPGHIEWLVDSIQINTNNRNPIKFTLKYPPYGDTIDYSIFKSKFVPLTNSSNLDTTRFRTSQNISVLPNFEPHPIGKTKGLKWLKSDKDSTSINYNKSTNITHVELTKDGNYYLFIEKIYPGNNITLNKISFDGLKVWQKRIDSLFPNANYLQGVSVRSTNDGGCVVLGNIEMNDNNDVFIAKFDINGNIVWSKTLTGSRNESFDIPNNFSVLSDGSFIITGMTESNNGDFANSLADSTCRNLFITKLSSNGNVIWSKVYGGSRNDIGSKIFALQNGTFLVLGKTESIDGDVTGAHQHEVGSVSQFSFDTTFYSEAWLLNIDGSGNIIWNKCFGGTKSSFFSGMTESNGEILLTGWTDSKNGDLPNYEEAKVPIWFVHISNTGNINWMKLHKIYKGYPSNNYLFAQEVFNSITTDLIKSNDGNYIVAATISDKYGFVQAKHGNADFILIKVNPSGDIIWHRAIGGTKYDFVYNLIQDKNGDIVFAGETYSNNDDLYEPNDGSLGIVAKFGITNQIKGNVFLDYNGNHVKDNNEPAFNQGVIKSAKSSDSTFARIYIGQYLNNVDTGTYVTTYNYTNNYYTIYPQAGFSSTFTTLDQTDSVDFALVPKPNINDLEINLIPLSAARPGFDANYRIITKNVGTENISNAVISLKKDSRQTFVSSSRNYTGILNDSIWWGPQTFNRNTSDTIDIVLKQAIPPTLNNGDTLSLRTIANPILNDSSVSNNTSIIRQTVVGSFDPNDKTEMHGGYLTPAKYQAGEYLEYLIRFQNTGTDTAFYVTIKDTLDAKLNWQSIETIAASHPYKFKLEGNVATWQFDLIKLVDSITNEPKSHGHILFKIKPNTGLNVGDIFNNKAAIYFDFNLPVITNIAQVNLSSPIVTAVTTINNETIPVAVYPNPAEQFINIKMKRFIKPINYSISDVQGKILRTGILQKDITPIDVSNLQSGIYFIQLNNPSRVSLPFIKK